MPIIPALQSLGLEDRQEFQASLGYIARLTKIQREKVEKKSRRWA